MNTEIINLESNIHCDESGDYLNMFNDFFYHFIDSVRHDDSADEDHCKKCMIYDINDSDFKRAIGDFSHQIRTLILFSIRIVDKSVI